MIHCQSWCDSEYQWFVSQNDMCLCLPQFVVAPSHYSASPLLEYPTPCQYNLPLSNCWNHLPRSELHSLEKCVQNVKTLLINMLQSNTKTFIQHFKKDFASEGKSGKSWKESPRMFPLVSLALEKQTSNGCQNRAARKSRWPPPKK